MSSPLSPKQQEAHDRLQNDYRFFSRHALKIKDKVTGIISPLIFNSAQNYLHDKLEEQLKATGKIRAIILKGRQQGCCYSPEMRVLTADYRWVSLADVKVGEQLLAVDEDLGELNAAKRRTERRIRTTVVEAKVSMRAMTFKVTLLNGVVLVVTGGHRHLCRQRGGDSARWRKVADTKPGDYIRVVTSAPAAPRDFEDGWFSGLLDGEGSFGASPQVRIGVSQVNGAVLQRAKEYLNKRGILFYELIDRRVLGASSKLGAKAVHCLRIDRMSDVLKLLCLTRPSRFSAKQLFEGKKLPNTAPGFEAWVKVISIEPAGEQEVIDLQTSQKTFICEGVVSHNSTYVEGRFYWKTTRNKGKATFILSHEADTTEKLFQMVERYHDNCPPPLKPATDIANRRRMIFSGLNSEYFVGTAGSKDVGRGGTIQLFHGSEVAFWENTDGITTGLMQSIPDAAGTEIILESTANGMGNYFHTQCMQALAKKGEYILIFIPWFWQTEYTKTPPKDFHRTVEEQELAMLYKLTDGQLFWRRMKIVDFETEKKNGPAKFRQEYPCNIQEAFQASGASLIKPENIMKARKSGIRDPHAPRVGGLDPGRDGDRTCFVERQGRAINWFKTYEAAESKGADSQWEMRLAGIAAKFIDANHWEKLFIDCTKGWGTHDRLHEMGYGDIVVGVQFGEGAIEDSVYLNKRAEMWDLMAIWFTGEVSVPDDDEFHQDVAMMPDKKETSSGLIKMESKDIIRSTYGKSPDIGDAAALTFAYPVRRDDLDEMGTPRRRINKVTKAKSSLTTMNKIRSRQQQTTTVPHFMGRR